MSWIPILAAGFAVTLELASLATLFAVLVSASLAILSIAPSRILRIIASLYVDIFRSIPILAFLIFLYYGLGIILVHLGISAFWVAVAGLSLIESAYLAETYRGALQAVNTSQWHAGTSLGLSWSSTLRLVILPQAVPSALPGTVNMVVVIIKDSSLASLVAVNELTLVAAELVSLTFQPVPIYVLLSLFYLALILPFSAMGYAAERVVARTIGAPATQGPSGPSASLMRRVFAGLQGRWN